MDTPCRKVLFCFEAFLHKKYLAMITEKLAEIEKRTEQNIRLEQYKLETLRYVKKLLSENSISNLDDETNKRNIATNLLLALKGTELGVKQCSLIYEVVR